MQIKFLGTTGAVTGSKYLVSTASNKKSRRLRIVPGLQAIQTEKLGAIASESRGNKCCNFNACPCDP